MTIRVYLIDDSAIVRQTLLQLLQGDREIELVGSAPNPLIAAAALRKARPDVLLLDIEMPGMDGLTFLRQIMAQAPIPTVICSSLTAGGGRTALEALAAGAVAVIDKPRIGVRQFLEEWRRDLRQALTAAAAARPRARPAGGQLEAAAPKCGAAPVAPGLPATRPVVLGSSTGGTQAIETVLRALPSDSAGIAIVLHMPERFTALYAQRLDGLCAMTVREARDGDPLQRGLVLIAPGGRHMRLRRHVDRYVAQIVDGPPINRHKPAVDVLFQSAADCGGADVLAILLTGMGDDGARGMQRLHQRGAHTIAQDEQSCVVFGMPKAAIALGAVDEVLPIEQIAQAIRQFDARNGSLIGARAG